MKLKQRCLFFQKHQSVLDDIHFLWITIKKGIIKKTAPLVDLCSSLSRCSPRPHCKNISYEIIMTQLWNYYDSNIKLHIARVWQNFTYAFACLIRWTKQSLKRWHQCLLNVTPISSPSPSLPCPNIFYVLPGRSKMNWLLWFHLSVARLVTMGNLSLTESSILGTFLTQPLKSQWQAGHTSIMFYVFPITVYCFTSRLGPLSKLQLTKEWAHWFPEE